MDFFSERTEPASEETGSFSGFFGEIDVRRVSGLFLQPLRGGREFFSRVPDGSLHGTGDGLPVGKPVSHGSQFFLHDAAGFPGCISHNLAYRFQMLRPAADAVLQTAEKAWRGFLS